MIEKYKIYPCGEHTGILIDAVNARRPNETIRKILKEGYFEAKEIKEANKNGQN